MQAYLFQKFKVVLNEKISKCAGIVIKLSKIGRKQWVWSTEDLLMMPVVIIYNINACGKKINAAFRNRQQHINCFQYHKAAVTRKLTLKCKQQNSDPPLTQNQFATDCFQVLN